jgi:sigma-B regulation protein RsbU (phosphoserine phosphatase)
MATAVQPQVQSQWGERVRSRITTRLKRPPPRGLPGVAFWLAVWFFLLALLRMIPGQWGTLFAVLQWMDAIALFCVAIPLAMRFVRDQLLWSLRSRLILTYLLFGLSPVVLGVTLVSVFGYISAGQFAIHLADTRLLTERDRLRGQTGNRFNRMMASTYVAPQNMGVRAQDIAAALPSDQEGNPLDMPRQALHPRTRVYLDGVLLDIGEPQAARDDTAMKTPLGLPPWAATLQDGRFSGLVLDGDDLYLVAINQQKLANGQVLSLLSSVLVDEKLMDLVADGLGRAKLYAFATNPEPETGSEKTVDLSQKDIQVTDTDKHKRRRHAPDSVAGGTAPPGVNVADIQVKFLSTMAVTDWDNGAIDNIPIEVDSRPSLLYKQLFGGSLGGVLTSVYRIGLVVLIIIFALIEAFAFYLAVRLGRTITQSVADLYAATERIDRGDFNYRIEVKGEDQLSELGASFNSMTGSLQRLLVEQQEKERLQNELSIAQEVQANLFPHADCDLANLQLHGVCRPARSVSGDYYDFILFHKEAERGSKGKRVETGVGIALGDISGKGISAALLMATLHSAVRAYRFASEEIVFASSSVAGLMSSREDYGDDAGELFESPGRILSLLNRHLYRSTQPEKYATLFLAHYDAASSWMTYSNAGQLPPLVLSRDGSIRRLDVGGTVVGLMDGMEYAEDGFQMRSGDVMVAYSDGVTEPENDFGDFGEERLMEVVARYRDEPLHVISAQVMQALDAWIGAEEQPDDITLVLARQA